jgi:O-antigen/teichoic acid export membrane protein
MIKLFWKVYSRLTSGGSTEEMAIQSGIWVTGINVADRALQLVNVIILARLLSPEAFGLLGIALVVLAAFQQLSKLGFDEALVQHRDENIDQYLNTAWLMKIGRGAFIALAAFILGPYISEFFGEPDAAAIIQVIGISPLLLSLQNPAIVYFQKDLEFHKEFAYKIGGRIVDLVTAIAFALIFQNVWALVVGLLAGRVTMLLLSYTIHDYRPQIEFVWEYGQEMFDFGKWLFLSGILFFLYAQGDDAFVGWFFGATALGYYQLAYRFSNAPATEVTQVIARVSFPAFSKIQDDTQKLREGYFRVLHATTLVGFPIAAGLIAVAPQFVHVVLGSQWIETIILIQVLALWGAIRAFGASTGALFKAIGRPDITTKLQAIKVAILVITIYPASTQWGVTGVAVAVVANAVLIQPIVVYLIVSVTEGSLKRLLFLLICPLAGSTLMALGVVGVDEYVFDGTGILQLLFLIAVGVVIYVIFMLLLEETSQYEFSELYHTLRGAV